MSIYILKVLCVGSGGEELEFERLGSTECYFVINLFLYFVNKKKVPRAQMDEGGPMRR